MHSTTPARVAVIGGGPAGLMAAEAMAKAGAGAGLAISVFDRMPSFGRKLLMAGRGGLNITHSEPLPKFRSRYGAAAGRMEAALDAFSPEALREWCAALGQPTFVGSSGRVFPQAMKASPLLRAWLSRLNDLGVDLRPRMDWAGWTEDGALRFTDGSRHKADAVILALGGASWPRLGADGGWTALLPGIGIAPLQPANCGFHVAWSQHLIDRHAGAPLKRIALIHGDRVLRGEAVITAAGIEGGAVYALSASLRDAIARDGSALLKVDLRPDLDAAALAAVIAEPRRGASLSNFLRKRLALSPAAIGLVQETLHADKALPLDQAIKALPLRLTAPFGLERAISTAGGIRLDELDARLMLRSRPGVFVAGEMLDWEAPTGGYLLQACLATGLMAGRGAAAWLQENRS